MSSNHLPLPGQQLYELVWSKPMPQVAAGFGISDVALALRFMDLTLRAAHQHGWTLVAPEPPEPTGVDTYHRNGNPAAPSPPPPADGLLQVGDVCLEFQIEERSAVISIPPSDRDLARQKRDPYFLALDTSGTRYLGLLRFVRPSPGYRYETQKRS